MTEKIARRAAQALAAYSAVERALISHRDDEDPAELIRLADQWVAIAREVVRARSLAEHDVLTAPLREESA